MSSGELLNNIIFHLPNNRAAMRSYFTVDVLLLAIFSRRSPRYTNEWIYNYGTILDQS